ncbi:MAG: tetratricopeptide repeat protein [Elusimicrobia bacterium]|nr:tetratricopeptide repeat protein [Elusimicrobiota bacterium]
MIAVALGWLPVDKSRAEAPSWVVGTAGCVFLFGGLTALVPPGFARLQHFFGTLAVTALALTFDWVAFGPGERTFSGSTTIGGLSRTSHVGQTGGRVVFGVFAILIDCMAALGWYRCLWPPSGGPGHDAGDQRPPTGIQDWAPLATAVLLLTGATVTMLKKHPRPAAASVTRAPQPPKRRPSQDLTVTMTSPRQEGSVEFYASEAGKIYQRGNEHQNKRETQAAIQDFSEAIRLAPQRAEVYFSRALSYEILGKDAEALADYSRAIRLKPKDPAYYFHRGMLLTNMGKHPEALADCERLKDLDVDAAKNLCGYLTPGR